MAKLETVAVVTDVEGSVYEIVLNNGQREMLISFICELFEGRPIICSDHKLPLTIQMVGWWIPCTNRKQMRARKK